MKVESWWSEITDVLNAQWMTVDSLKVSEQRSNILRHLYFKKITFPN